MKMKDRLQLSIVMYDAVHANDPLFNLQLHQQVPQ